MPIAVLFVVLLIITNIVVQKVIPVLGYFILTVGDFIFPLVYIMDGLLTEVYGYAASRRVIWLALFCNILMALIVMFAISLPAARDWPYQDQFVLILGRAPQIVGASVIAFLVGEFVNSYILARLKVVMHGKKLWFRSFTAMATGQGIDTILFNTIAFFGILSWHRIFVLSVSVYCFKLLYEVIFIPVIYLLADILKHKEGIDIYDKNTNFNPFKLKWV
jgi:hypothetical protein